MQDKGYGATPHRCKTDKARSLSGMVSCHLPIPAKTCEKFGSHSMALIG